MRNTVNLKLNLLDDPDVFDYTYVNQNNEILDREYGNLFNNKSEYVLTAGNANTYLATLEGITGYYEGLCLKIKIHVDSSNKCTLNVNGLGAKYIKDSYGNIVTNLKKDIPYHVCYNGSAFILLGKGGGGNAQSNHVLENYTFTNDSGPQKGTMKNNGSKIYTPGRNNIAIPEGYHNGEGYIKGDSNLIPENIANGITMFGVTGTSGGEFTIMQKYQMDLTNLFNDMSIAIPIPYNKLLYLKQTYHNDTYYHAVPKTKELKSVRFTLQLHYEDHASDGKSWWYREIYYKGDIKFENENGNTKLNLYNGKIIYFTKGYQNSSGTSEEIDYNRYLKLCNDMGFDPLKSYQYDLGYLN